jgi:hypothetical protein
MSLTSDESILKFAQKFGSLTGYGQVRLYSVAMAFSEEIQEPRRPSRDAGAGQPYRESLKLWRKCQEDFEVILALASGLNEATGPKRALFDRYEAQSFGVVRQRRLATPESRRRETARILTWSTQKLILYVGLQPTLRFRATKDGDFRTELMFEDGLAREWFVPAISVLGALVVQLLAATAGNGFAICASCGRAFVPKRKPAAGRRSYCQSPSCGRRAAMRDAKAAQRRRERALRQTAEAPTV